MSITAVLVRGDRRQVLQVHHILGGGCGADIGGDTIAQKGVVNEWYATINESLRPGYYWTFTRKWGQPALVSVGYGFLAAAVARLTGGFLYSSDGAWEYATFPAWPEAFVASYLRPEKRQDPGGREHALWCRQWLGEEIRKINNG